MTPLSTAEKRTLLTLLLKYEDLFDGSLGDFKTEPKKRDETISPNYLLYSFLFLEYSAYMKS